MKKNLYVRAILLPLIIFLCAFTKAYSQAWGANMSNPIEANIFYGSSYTDTQNNSSENGFGNEIGHPSDDIYYRFSLSYASDITISHCASGFDTYLHVLDEYGNTITSADDNGPLCSSLQASTTLHLNPGTYFVVSEGYSSWSGDITTEISLLTPPPIAAEGANLANSIQAGTLVSGIPFTSTLNNSPVNGYSDDYGMPSDDIYYTFTLSSPAEVSISHCGSAFDTYLHLLDASGSPITTNDDNGPVCPYVLQSSIKIQLAAGTYFVVSEGYAYSSGDITTTISIPDSREINTEFAQQMNQVFSSLETQRVPYGLLQDMALEQTNLANYRGDALTDTNYVDNKEFYSIYNSLLSAKINTTAGTFTPANELDSLCFGQREPGKMVLSGLFYRYARFKDNALQSNEITVSNNKVYDKYNSGIWQNPYQNETAFAISPATTRYEGLSQQVILPANLWLSNDGQAVNSIELDAGDGQGYRSLNPGQAITINYPDTGRKVLTYKLNLSGNNSLYSHSEIHVRATLAAQHSQALLANTPPPNPQVISITATESFEGETAKGYMTIRYVNPTLGLRRPLIVAEGFDPGHITDPESEYGDTDIESFRRTIRENQNLLQNIINDVPQYDLVYVDWKRGTDNIKKNAKLLKDVIRRVNQLKAQAGSTQKNIIIGQSMGGLVTRWALKEMENANENHQVSLFVSHDSPHQGANVPLGYQYLARHVNNLYLKAGMISAPTEYVQLLSGGARPSRVLNLANTAAARQMLINYVNNDFNIDNSVHDQWQAELSNIGYPQGFPGSPLRKVAVSNASECAVAQPGTPGSELLNYEGKGNTRLLGDIAAMGAFPIIGTLLNQPALGLGILPGRNDINFNLKVNANVEGGGNQVYKFKISYKKKILWMIPVTVNITDRSYSSPSGSLAYDSYPGGFYSTGIDLQNSNDQNWFYKYNITASNVPTFNFIPSVSSLDIGSGNVPLTEADYTAKYIGAAPPTGAKSSPFANFITAFNNGNSANEEHISFQTRNGDFVAEELTAATANNTNYAQPPNCTSFCGVLQIEGSGASYYINNAPSPANITWSLTNSTGSISLCNTSGTSVNLFGVGTGTLQAVINSPCGNLTLPAKQIELSEIKIAGYTSFCNGASYSIDNIPNNSTVTWSVSGNIAISGENTLQYVAIESTVFGSSGSITATISSPCLGTITLEKNVFTSPNLENFRFENGGSGTYPGVPGYDGGPIFVKVDPHPNVSSYEWYVDGILVETTTYPSMITYNYDYNACGIHDILVKGYTGCGSPEESYAMTGNVFEVKCYYNNYYSYSIYPNPSSDEITVSTIDPQAGTSITSPSKKDTKAKAKRSFDVKIYDKMGKVLRNGKSNDLEKITLNTREIPEDTYFLHITEGKEVIKKLIIIKH